MKMPWPVKVVLGWFALLAVASCAPLCLYVGSLFSRGFDENILNLVLTLLSLAALIVLGVGFALAIFRGRRSWVSVPYAIMGGVIISVLLASTGMVDKKNEAGLYLIGVAVATVVPLGLMHLPVSNRWFAAKKTEPVLNPGCLWLTVVMVLGALVGATDTGPRLPARTQAMMMSGRKVFVDLLAPNLLAKELDRPWVDPSSCSNSIEYVEKLSALFDKDGGVDLAQLGREWSFVVGLPEDASDEFPVMFSANVDPRILPREWDGKTGRDELLEPKPLAGMEPPDVKVNTIVVMRKNGAAQIVKRKYLRRGVLFHDQPYKLDGNVYFLTPVGKLKWKVNGEK